MGEGIGRRGAWGKGAYDGKCVGEGEELVVMPPLCCSVLQCVAVCCSVLQCVAVCCSVVQRFV